MALVWIEGFETHAQTAQLARKYATQSGALAVVAGRVHGNAIGINTTVLVTPSRGLTNTLLTGIAIRVNTTSTTNPSNAGIYLEKGANEQVHLEVVNGAGFFNLRLMRGATQLAITTDNYEHNVWHWFELLVLVHTSTGAYELRHNEVTVFSATGVNTAQAGTDQADVWAIRYGTNLSTTLFFDDIYVCNAEGGINDDFLGDSIVEGILPNGAGASTQWTPSAGSNFDNVDDSATVAPDDAGAGGFNSSDTNGQEDLYAYGDLTQIQGDIHGIQIDTQLAMAAAGSRTVDIRYRDPSTTTTDVDTIVVASTVYDSFPTLVDQNPVTVAPWDLNDIQNGQFGLEVVS